MRKMKKWLYGCAMICLLMVISLVGNMEKAEAAEIQLKEPKIVSVGAASDITTALRVTWQPVERADGYIIYRKDPGSTSWERIKKVAGQSKSYYSNIKLEPGTKYTYTVQSFCKVDGKVYYSTKGTNPVTAVTHLKTPGLKSATSVTYNQIKVVWTPVTNAQGYRIYRKESGSGWKLVRRISGENKYYCIDSTAEPGKQYYYTVRATCSWDGTLYLSPYNTKGIAGKASLGGTTITSIQLNGNDQVTLKWTSVAGAQGYVIQKSNSASGTYKKIKTIQSGSTVSWTGSISAGETAYFRIRAFKQLSNGQFTYGAFSPVKQVASKNIEITDYIKGYNEATARSDVDRLAKAIGGLSPISVSGFYYVLESQNTGIYLSRNVDMAQGYYNLIIETIDPKVTFHGMKVGDTQQSASAKLKTAGFIDGGQNSQGYEVFVHNTDPQIVFVGFSGGKVDIYQFVAIDESYFSSVSSVLAPRQYRAYVR